jgi:diguanylate cyclase (GGDEF)-like protein
MKVVVVGKNKIGKKLSGILDEIFETVYILHNPNEAVSLIYTDPPDIIIVDKEFAREGGGKGIQEFRSNTIYGHLPIVAIFDAEDTEDSGWDDIPVDDFILSSESRLSISKRLPFIVKRSIKELDTNPLTRLPGNESIIRHIQRMLDKEEEIAIAWLDLDHFKPYNDYYGFARGDEVLLATARIITNAIKELKQEPTFLGHIGGDDFVFTCPISSIKGLCEEIISLFDMVIRNFYNDEDLHQGYIVSKDRTSKTKMFPILTVSIATVLNKNGRFKHYGEASRDATEIKDHIKAMEGSNYMIDRRSSRE